MNQLTKDIIGAVLPNYAMQRAWARATNDPEDVAPAVRRSQKIQLLGIMTAAAVMSAVAATPGLIQNGADLWNAHDARAAVSQAAQEITGPASVEALAVEAALTRAGHEFTNPGHEASMDQLSAMATKALASGIVTHADYSKADARAEDQVARGEWSVEAFDAWAAAITGFEAGLKGDIDVVRAEIEQRSGTWTADDAAAWHVARVELDWVVKGEAPAFGMDDSIADQTGTTLPGGRLDEMQDVLQVLRDRVDQRVFEAMTGQSYEQVVAAADMDAPTL